MNKDNVIKIIENPQGIEGLKVITPVIHEDSRGYFSETYNKIDFDLGVDFVQDNESSSHPGVLRGLHIQQAPYAQDKLVRVIKGHVFDVAVDLRSDSETFGKWYGIVLSEKNKKQFFIPKGFAHGFLVLNNFNRREETIFSYKVSDYYNPESEIGIKWDDPDININWPIFGFAHTKNGKVEYEFELSEKDKKNISFQEYKAMFP